VKNLLQEIHGRSLWQVLGLYLAGSWLVLQVVDTLESVIGLPAWAPRAAVVLLLVGLPVVMATAFFQRGLGGRSEASEEESAPSAEVIARRRLFSWRNALLGGLGAFTLLGLGTAAWLGMRAAGIGPAGTLVARGVLDQRDVVLLADFGNSTNDPTLSAVVTEALRVDLSQSEAVAMADRGFLADALARMQRPEDTPITEEVAFEIARREGIKAILTGDVARAGGGYVLSASVLAPEDGEILVSHRESARDSTRLLDAIDALSRHMRERIGDPLRSIAASPPLAQVTTTNLEALRSYTRAMRLPQSEATRRIELFKAAVAADSMFASAWQALGTQLNNYGVEPGRAMQARTRAFELRGNLTERESNFVAAMYYLGVTNEPRQAIPFMEAIVEVNPADAGPLNNLGEAYRNIGDLQTALELYERSIAADSSTASIPLMNVAQVKATLGDTVGALAAADLLDIYEPGPFGAWHRAMAFSAVREYERAETSMKSASDGLAGSPFLLAQTRQWAGAIAAVRGRLDEAAEGWEEAGSLMAADGSTVEALRNLVAIELMRRSAYPESDAVGLDDALAAYPLTDWDPVVRPYLDVAEAYASLGRPDRARALLEEFEASTPENFRHGLRAQMHAVMGEIAMAEGRPEAAISEFRQSAPRPQELEPMVRLARAFDAAGEADSARVHYERFLSSPHWLSVFPHARFLAGAFERAAELEYEAGDLRKAAGYLAEFVNLWVDADVALQPRVRAAQARLQEIIDEMG
jgi:tetratricopeptide (TPR) repeat protein